MISSPAVAAYGGGRCSHAALRGVGRASRSRIDTGLALLSAPIRAAWLWGKSMQNEQPAFGYQGHQVEVELLGRQGGRWSWAFVVDGEHRHENGNTPLSTKNLALLEANITAKAWIEAKHLKADTK